MILVTGSAGHLGEALVRTLRQRDTPVLGLDIKASPFTDLEGSLADRAFVRDAMSGVSAVIHTATLHKPHVGTHSRQDFVDTNVSGTLNLLEEALNQHCDAFIYTSTTSVFGDAMKPAPNEPAIWVTEQLEPRVKNIYGVTKRTAEDLCQIFHRNTGLPCLVLRTSRFFPEPDDDSGKRSAYDDDNLKVNEFLFRRVDIADIVTAHLLALTKAAAIGFDKFIISAPTPFDRNDAEELGNDAPAVLARYFPDFPQIYSARGWQMFQGLDRVYDSAHAQQLLDWHPVFDFRKVLDDVSAGRNYRSELARTIGSKGYHGGDFEDGIYPVSSF